MKRLIPILLLLPLAAHAWTVSSQDYPPTYVTGPSDKGQPVPVDKSCFRFGSSMVCGPASQRPELRLCKEERCTPFFPIYRVDVITP